MLADNTRLVVLVASSKQAEEGGGFSILLEACSIDSTINQQPFTHTSDPVVSNLNLYGRKLNVTTGFLW